MKKSLIVLAFFLGHTLYAQTYKTYQTYKFYQTENIHNKLRLNTKTGEIYQIQSDGQKFLVKLSISPENQKAGKYSLHKTENMWTYILLDTYSGRLWQVQYSIDGYENRGSWAINSYALSISETRKFSIEPLVSMFQFYLIDDETGDMWKFQWSTKGEDYRWIERF